MKTKGFITCVLAMLSLLAMNSALGQWSYNGTHIYNNNSGYVGIGNSSPAKLLYVGKNMTEPTITVRNFGGTGGATFQMIDDASTADWKFKATNTGGFKIRDNANSLDVFVIEPNSAENSIYINSNGHVGIGTSTPSKDLHVVGDIILSDFSPYITIDNTMSYTDGGLKFTLNGDDKAWISYDMAESRLKLSNDDLGGGRNDLVILSDGQVGVGTGTPSSRLEVYYDSLGYIKLGNSNALGSYFYHEEDPDDGDGQAALYALRTHVILNNGSGYGGGANSALKGENWAGDKYSFGIVGVNWPNWDRNGGIIGAEFGGDYWGSLGYKSSGGIGYGGYFTSSEFGGGKSSQTSYIGVALGAWGDLIGADIHGKVYGAYIEGGNYAIYSHGAVYKDDLDVHLQENRTGENTVMYTCVSTDVCVQTSGIANLSNGTVSIVFDPAFTAIVSSEDPVVVTITPLGTSNGLYLSDVSSTGFTVAENNNGRSNITINYIAIGKRAGYENPVLPKEVIDAGYTRNMTRGLHNDADTKTDGEGLYYENGQLVVGIHPSSLPDPDKPVVEIANSQTDNISRADNPAGKAGQNSK